MKKKIYLIISALITAVLITGCENLYYDAYNSANPNVYVTGYERHTADGFRNALYWKNGSMQRLTDYGSTNLKYAYGNSIFVYEGKVYIAGYDDSKAFCYTGSGELNYLMDNAEAKSVFVYEGDVYVAGYDSTDTPRTWKNSELIALGISIKTRATSFFVYHGNTYVSGTDIGSSHAAVCWINGTKSFISGNDADANSIFVYNGDVYVAGHINNSLSHDACYWKNNNRVMLTSGTSAYAASIFVDDGDVYIAGTASNRAVYWKNNQIVYLTDGTYIAETTSIFVYNGDVYVAGREDSNGGREVAKYWKNGKEVVLYSGANHYKATSIFVSGE